MTPEEMQAEIIRLKEEAEQFKNLKAEIDEKNKRITELQEHNQKLFLKITHEPEKEEPDGPEMTIEEFANTIKL